MILPIFLITTGCVILLFSLFASRNKGNKKEYLESFGKTVIVGSLDTNKQAFNLSALSKESFIELLQRYAKSLANQLGPLYLIKIAVFCSLLLMFSLYLNSNFLRMNQMWVSLVTLLLGIAWGISFLNKREKERFESTFPDALNMLASAVSAGESITQAMAFVGRNLAGPVGSEFKLMADRLQVGEPPEVVFSKSCNRFPYPTFYFFVISMRANMIRGGQLKEIISRLNRVMFDARAVEKKKFALTSEARISAKIVGAIPFLFLFALQYLSPENFEYVMYTDAGRPILYYVLISESIGMFIVWLLMKSVR